jgi:hypothetical protein
MPPTFVEDPATGIVTSVADNPLTFIELTPANGIVTSLARVANTFIELNPANGIVSSLLRVDGTFVEVNPATGIVTFVPNVGGGTTLGVLAASRGQVPMNVGGAWSANTTYTREYYAHPKGAISNLKTLDTNWCWNGTAGWTAITTYTIKRFLEYPAGVFTPITWAGGTVTNRTFTSALTQAQMTSDPVAVTIPAGAQFWIRTVWLAGTLPVLMMIGSSSNSGATDGSVAGDFGNSGTIPANATGNTFGPPAILGDVAVSNARSFLLMGDSECWGGITQDSNGDYQGQGPLGGSGYMARVCDPVAPYCKLCFPGEQSSQVVTNLTASGGINRVTNFMNALNYSEMWLEYGINDLGIGLATPTQLLANVATLAGLVRPGAVVSASTINAVSGAANTVPWSHGVDQNTYDASIRARPTWLTGNIYDIADASMTSRDSGVWNSTGGTWQQDGTHPNTHGAIGIVTNLGPI